MFTVVNVIARVSVRPVLIRPFLTKSSLVYFYRVVVDFSPPPAESKS
jgi:hypothetical protein